MKKTTPSTARSVWTLGTKSGKAANQRLNDGIRHELRNFEKATVEQFVRSVGATLGAYDITKMYPERQRKDQLEKLRDVGEEYMRVGFLPVMAEPFPQRIEPFKAGADVPAVQVLWGPYNTVAAPTISPANKEAQRFYRSRDAAQRALSAYLIEINRAIQEATPRPAQRPPADEHGVLARIAIRYALLFKDIPKTTPGGRFSNIATLVLENMHGKPPKDVTRQVRAAVKALRQYGDEK